MESDGREGSSLFKHSGSKHVEPTSGQQGWQTFISAQHLEGCMEATAVTQHWKLGQPGIQQQGGAEWSREMDDEQTSGFHVVHVFVV